MEINVMKITNKIELLATADMFIIPYRAFQLVDIGNLNKICEIVNFAEHNNVYLQMNDYIVAVCLNSPQFRSDNISEQGIYIHESCIKEMSILKPVNGYIHIDNNYTQFMGYMPISMIADISEDQSKKFRYDIVLSDYDKNECTDIILHLNIKANQLSYEYKLLGRFEDAFKESLNIH